MKNKLAGPQAAPALAAAAAAGHRALPNLRSINGMNLFHVAGGATADNIIRD